MRDGQVSPLATSPTRQHCPSRFFLLSFDFEIILDQTYFGGSPIDRFDLLLELRLGNGSISICKSSEVEGNDILVMKNCPSLGVHTVPVLVRKLPQSWCANCPSLGAQTVPVLVRKLPQSWCANCPLLVCKLPQSWCANCPSLGVQTAQVLV